MPVPLEKSTDPGSPPTCNVLFVCEGNICRSKSAEEITLQIAQKKGLSEFIKVSSAGLAAREGTSTSLKAIEALKQAGFGETSSSLAQQITAEALEKANIVFAMTKQQGEALKEYCLKHCPKAANKIYILGQLEPNSDPKSKAGPKEINDPFLTNTDRAYKKSIEQIIPLVSNLVSILEKIHRSSLATLKEGQKEISPATQEKETTPSSGSSPAPSVNEEKKTVQTKEDGKKVKKTKTLDKDPPASKNDTPVKNTEFRRSYTYLQNPEGRHPKLQKQRRTPKTYYERG